MDDQSRLRFDRYYGINTDMAMILYALVVTFLFLAAATAVQARRLAPLGRHAHNALGVRGVVGMSPWQDSGSVPHPPQEKHKHKTSCNFLFSNKLQRLRSTSVYNIIKISGGYFFEIPSVPSPIIHKYQKQTIHYIFAKCRCGRLSAWGGLC